jgi:hypothetical protein
VKEKQEKRYCQQPEKATPRQLLSGFFQPSVPETDSQGRSFEVGGFFRQPELNLAFPGTENMAEGPPLALGTNGRQALVAFAPGNGVGVALTYAGFTHHNGIQ